MAIKKLQNDHIRVIGRNRINMGGPFLLFSWDEKDPIDLMMIGTLPLTLDQWKDVIDKAQYNLRALTAAIERESTKREGVIA